MVLVILHLILLCHDVSAFAMPELKQSYSKELVKCVTNIVEKYFVSRKVLTYIGNSKSDEIFLEAFHNLNAVAMLSKVSSMEATMIHKSYFISSRDCSIFLKWFPYLSKETTWNPHAYFLMIFKSLSDCNLSSIFDEFLRQRVINVLVINATDEAQLYGYNPYDNYGCGKFYNNIINYGKCSQMHKHDLFPSKYVTGLKNCTFNVAIPNSPPYTLFSSNDTDNSSPLSYGVEPYLLRLVGELKSFTWNIIMENITETLSAVSVQSDMEADGPLKMLENNKADVVLGALLLTPSRAIAFEYVYDFLPYVDEIRFVLRRAEFVPAWKTFYLEFDGLVWVLILLSLTIYSILMITLLRVQDKSLLIFKLVDSLVLHSCDIVCHSTIKGILIIWIWFAYLINTFYQSSLVSLTTNPAVECQISDEEDITHHKLRPCFDEIMERYYKESTQLNHNNISVSECKIQDGDVLRTLVNTRGYYSLTLYGFYEYNIQQYYDINGNPQLYLFKTPYSKVIYCMYFYKGFPFIYDIKMSALRIREMGFVGKAMSDMNYIQSIKHNFHGNKQNRGFVVPWHIYIFGCIVAIITFLVEMLSIRSF